MISDDIKRNRMSGWAWICSNWCPPWWILTHFITLLPLSYIRESHDTRPSSPFVASARYNPWCQQAGELLPNPGFAGFAWWKWQSTGPKIIYLDLFWFGQSINHAHSTREVLPTHSAREAFFNDHTPFPQLQYKSKATVTPSNHVKTRLS